MKRPLHFLVFLAAGVAFAQPPAPTPAPSALSPGDGVIGPPAKNWVLPLFSDKDGFRLMTLRGSEARTIGSNRIDITDLNITSFTGDATARVETLLLAPAAQFFPDAKRATGDKSVRLIRDDMEVTGTVWSFNQGEKRVLIQKSVHVVLHSPLPLLLK